MTTMSTQAISGVSSDSENVVMTVWPSIAATGWGRILGSLYDSIPLKIFGVKISYLLFPLPTSPLGVVLYFWLKIFGYTYVLTNRSVQRWTGLEKRLVSQVSLSEIEEIEVQQQSGQEFYKASDLVLTTANGATLMTLEGIPRAEVFREIILEARDARIQVDASLATIAARQ